MWRYVSIVNLLILMKIRKGRIIINAIWYLRTHFIKITFAVGHLKNNFLFPLFIGKSLSIIDIIPMILCAVVLK